MKNMDIANCTSTEGGGGGMYVGNIKQLNISESRFRNNIANGQSGRGGGLLFECDNLGLNYLCLAHISDSQFTSNLADIEGGAIMAIIANLPNLISAGNIFLDNESLHRPNIGKTLTILECNYKLKRGNDKFLGEIAVNLVSGQFMQNPIIISLKDQDGNLITSDSDSTLYVDDILDQNVILVDNLITANNGVMFFDKLKVTHIPNSSISIDNIYIYICIYIYVYLTF